MSALAVVNPNSLPSLIDRAANSLISAHSAAEVLEARDMASAIYDAAKRAARFHAAKGAHDSLIATAHRAQANALEIEAAAKRRLADEYDAAQERGEVAGRGKPVNVPEGNIKAKVTDLGLTRKDIHEARIVRDAEQADPGIVRRTLDDKLNAGAEPTKATLRKALKAATPTVTRKIKKKPRRARQPYVETETQHDRDLRMLLGVWEAACPSAQQAFLLAIADATKVAA